MFRQDLKVVSTFIFEIQIGLILLRGKSQIWARPKGDENKKCNDWPHHCHKSL